MKSLFFIALIFLNFLSFASKVNTQTSEYCSVTDSILLTEKKLIATYDNFDGETYNFIGVDQYGEEYFFIVNKVEANVLTSFDLKSKALKNTKFEVYYKEESTDDSGNTIITVTKLIKI